VTAMMLQGARDQQRKRRGGIADFSAEDGRPDCF